MGCASKRVVIATDPDFDPERVDMDLRLTFDGLLMSTGNRGRPEHVHEIRRKFHPQLRRFWEVSPIINISNDGNKRVQGLATKFSKNGYRFVPLVERDRGWICAVSILLLRPLAVSRAVLSQGDLDGQLATLFDALAMPRHAEQLKGFETPSEGEDPFFCLLEDDSLITQASVETGLLLQTTEAGLDDNAARAVISVEVSWPPGTLGYGIWA